MRTTVNDRQIVERLEENGLRYAILPLQGDVFVIVTEYGGRILGPFLKPDSASLYWVNGVWSQPDAFRQFIAAREWNLGGDRMWIAPEIQYIVRDRNDLSTAIIPPEMDPGNWALDCPGPGQVRLRQDVTLTARVIASGQKTLHLESLIRKAEDPLRLLSHYERLVDGVVYAGYDQVVTLGEDRPDGIMSESWSVIQLNPGGEVLIPISPRFETTEYESLPVAEYQTFHGNYVSLKITGDRVYKTGYKAAHTTGRLAYLHHLDDGRAYLVVRIFFNNPSSVYVEEPAPEPGRQGDSIHVYNDSGVYGGYGELESHGQTIGGMTSRSSSTDPFVLWLYVGATAKINAIAAHLLGIIL